LVAGAHRVSEAGLEQKQVEGIVQATPVMVMDRLFASCLALVLGCSLVVAPAGQAVAASVFPEIRLAQALGSVGSDAPAQLKDVRSILGIEVRTSNERNVGRIVDLLFEPNGAVEAAVVEFGGFLGIGARKIAIEWSVLRFQAAENKLVAILDIPRDQLRSAPDYKPGQPAAIMKGDRPTE
jgi:hypothetical protein